ncbi:MAG: hypothetical protein PHI29_03390 [Gallionella sp.]|nr:hypothetical protein [Gallionella sp.]
MKKIFALLAVVSMLSGCLYGPYDARYPNAGHDRDRGNSGHGDRGDRGDRGEHRGHGD